MQKFCKTNYENNYIHEKGVTYIQCFWCYGEEDFQCSYNLGNTIWVFRKLGTKISKENLKQNWN